MPFFGPLPADAEVPATPWLAELFSEWTALKEFAERALMDKNEADREVEYLRGQVVRAREHQQEWIDHLSSRCRELEQEVERLKVEAPSDILGRRKAPDAT